MRGVTSQREVSVPVVKGLLNLLDETKLDVVAISETWLKSDEQVRQAERWAQTGGWTWHDHRRRVFDAKENKGSGGVALMVKERVGVEVTAVEVGGEGVLWASIKKHGVEFHVAAVYAVPFGGGKRPRVDMTERGLDRLMDEVRARRQRKRRGTL